MKGKNGVPRYAVRLLVLLVSVGVVFFTGLHFFVPAGSKLTGSYDAKSLLYIAAAPVSYRGASSCGSTHCHSDIFKQWSAGAHGAHEEQSKCEVCHGPQGEHPNKAGKLLKVRGDGNIVELCLTCHRKLKARSTTGQPQIIPQEHPYPHEGVLKCTQCHNPHSPGFSAPESRAKAADTSTESTNKSVASETPPIAQNCFPCHGPSGRGGFAPVLAGQPVESLKEKLSKFRSGERKGTMMNPIAGNLKDQEIEILAGYFSKN